MANVMVSMKIFPEDITIDLSNLREQIIKILPQSVSVRKFAEEPIAFGLVALIAHILMSEEKSGELEKVENAIRNIKGVSTIETFMMQRW
jgi:translation elongation factor aEF-1 beta